MNISRTKVRRAASKGLSVGLSATTTLWLVGSSVFMAVPAVQAANNEASVTDVTGTNPRIAANGESERVFLGINATRTDTTDVVQLNAVRVRLTSDDTANEAAEANIEKVRLYQDSGLSGTNGVFDANDALNKEVTRNTGGAGVNTTLATQTASAAVATKDATGGNAAPTTTICVTNAIAAGIPLGQVIAVNAGGVFAGRIVTVKTAVVNAAAAGTSCVAAAGAVATDTILTVDTAMTARTATDGTITPLGNYPVGITAINLTSATGYSTGDTLKIGTGATAETRGGAAAAATTVVPVLAIGGGASSPLTFAHANAEVVQEQNALIAADVANGFLAINAGETVVDVGDPGQAIITADLGFDIPKTDAGTDLGDDLFVVLVTKGGVANQTVKAQVFTSGDVEYLNNTGTPATVTATISSGAGTTSGKSKAVLFGTDGVAPTISKVESYDTNNDGIVDRFKVFFSESMANTETTTNNFKDAIGGTANRINALDASTTDLNLGAITWLTTTNLNDTAQFDVTNTGAYTSAAQSTGDIWSVVYDADLSNDLADATGTLLADQTISSTDKAQPFIVSALVKDNNANGKIDELQVVFSETMSASSTSAGFVLQDTVGTAFTYVLGGVLGLQTSTPAGFNANDTIRYAVTERTATDVGDTWTLSYTQQTSPAGAFDAAAATNNAQSRSGVVPSAGSNPLIVTVEYKDTATIGGIGAVANNGRIDTVVVTFNVNVTEVGGDAKAKFALSNGYVLAGTSTGTGTKIYTMGITEKTVDDTGVIPDLTYTDTGAANCLVSSGASCTTNQLLTVNSGNVVEMDKALPVLKTSTLYESTANDIWETGEGMQLVFSEPIDPATVSSSWNVAGGTGSTAFVDWNFVATVGGGALGDTFIPDSGTVSVSGNVVTLTPTASASAALTTANAVFVVPNEVKDLAANSAYPSVTGTAVALVVTPTTAPTIAKVATNDANGDGFLDSVIIYFNGLVKASTIVMADFAVASSAQFTGGEVGTSTTAAIVDRTVTSVVTFTGSDDSRVVVNYMQQRGATDGHPQVKYIQGSLADLAGNKVASFNQNPSDNTKWMTGALTNPAKDEADPRVMLKYLKDRDMNGKVDQLIVVFSEEMTPGTSSSSGWSVAGHSIASTGAYSTNVDYQVYTYSNLNAVFKVDVNELATESSSMPGVSYASSGQFKDLQSRLLGNVAAGGEQSNVTFTAPPPPSGLADGSLVKGTAPAVWVIKVMGSKTFKRHVLNANFDSFYPHLAPFWSKVMNVSDASVNAASMSAWIRVLGDTKVYEVNDDNSKHWISCADDSKGPGQDCANEWSASGRDSDGIYTVNSAEFNSYVTGPTVIMPDQVN